MEVSFFFVCLFSLFGLMLNVTVLALLCRSALEVSVADAIEKAAFKPIDLHAQGDICSIERPLNDNKLYYDVFWTFWKMMMIFFQILNEKVYYDVFVTFYTTY